MVEKRIKRTTKWDALEYLETQTDIAAYLNAALEDDAALITAAALGDAPPSQRG